ncbi:AI-2E family transporter [Mucilaginibacter sp. RS28]|uniref:AI-2E family transporter n=1 Tax=Mucilaginibacter straminoryzae TaxID=2932774 RepID=A0A9X1X1S5_9SPHI|nr:AI-2E family transporter [Mucilaginibacter straminoryzae]MCJ8208420.1 AI-2E family transporter [Mucilaginibacter straminoryzae]
MLQLNKILRILALICLSTLLLYFGATVFIPLTFGAVFAMLLMPLGSWLEKKGFNRGIASVACILVFTLCAAGLVYLLQWQISDLLKDLSQIEQRFQQLTDSLQRYASEHFGLSVHQQKQMIREQQSGGMEKATGMAWSAFSKFAGLMLDTVLVLVYTFLFLYFRRHFKNFVIRLVGNEDRKNTQVILQKISGVTQSYLSGLGMMIVMLWVMYGIGFSIVGIKGAILFAILCGLLEIIPFIGNLTGTTITVLITLAQGGSTNMVLGVLATYAIVQFTQTYLLEPLVVGRQVNINPLFTILIIVVGEAIWDIAGMILAIPLLGMFKVVCDHVTPLNAYGYLIGSGQHEQKDGNIFKKLFGRKED